MHGSKTLAYDPDSQLIDLENLICRQRAKKRWRISKPGG
jgi:hypothetical protein